MTQQECLMKTEKQEKDYWEGFHRRGTPHCYKCGNQVIKDKDYKCDVHGCSNNKNDTEWKD